MLRFTTIEPRGPEKRPPEARAQDFREVYAGYAAEKAAEQASRCSQCGVPFCQVHCPLANNIPDWLKLTAEGRTQEAYELSQSTNNMPEICGRICPQDRLCERHCVIEQSGHGTVTIGAIEKFLTDTAWREGWVRPLKARRERPQRVAIVGAGPAGLACAEQLRLKGYRVTVYDRHDKAGGLLMYGIPNFKLEKDVVARRVKRLAEGGVKFKLACEIGRDLSFEALHRSHDAVFLAPGAYQAREMEIDGIAALDYLIGGAPNAKDKHVAVIGGGDTAMDCVRTAIRQGAASVTCLYRRDRDNMPGSLREVVNAEEEGVAFEWLTLPKSAGMDGVRITRMRLGLPDASGRKAPEEITGADFTLKADIVIKALGFDPEPHWKEHFKRDGVFAGGDVVRGASLVVWAIKDGRDAARSIHSYLEKQVAEKCAEPA
ncbi:MAG TPA: NAD(P)-dependent oxidoreductase [Rhizomicrobium sp.]|nr:NAD(P)-dependent oxidoreductase [Rhizomicrobium sp.]